MHQRHLLHALPLFTLLLPTVRTASATPPDTQKAALPAPARAVAPRPIEVKPTADATATATAAATAVVEKQLVQPLADKETRRNRFSRAYIPPQARRVRVLDRERSTDARGAEFVAFAVDERSGVFARRAAEDPRGWRTDAIVGCVYPARDEIFIKRGDNFFAAGLLLGRRNIAADDLVCRPAPAKVQAAVPAKTRDPA